MTRIINEDDCAVILDANKSSWDSRHDDPIPEGKAIGVVGEHDFLRFRGLRGSVPIVNLNQVTVYDAEKTRFRNCSGGWKFLGNNVPELEYGFLFRGGIIRAFDEVASEQSGDFVISWVKMIDPGGLSIQITPSEGGIIENVLIEHVLVEGSEEGEAKGFYLGQPKWRERNTRLSNVEVRYCTLRRTREGIQVKGCVKGAHVHHNSLHGIITAGYGPWDAALLFDEGSVGSVHHNEVRGCDGIGLHVVTYHTGLVEAYANLLVDCGYRDDRWKHAVYIDHRGPARLFNNTVVGAGEWALYCSNASTGVQAHNNILLDWTDGAIRRGGSPADGFHHNLVDDELAEVFVDPANGDYHLTAGSPAIGAGVPPAPERDLDNALYGDPPSQGCYERQKIDPPDPEPSVWAIDINLDSPIRVIGESAGEPRVDVSEIER